MSQVRRGAVEQPRFKALMLQGLVLALIASQGIPGAAADEAARAYQRPGETEWISSAPGGGGDSWSMQPSVSDDGRYVAFWSMASNIVASDSNGVPDVFVRDRRTGAIELVSVGSDENQGNRISGGPVVSADGRYVAFSSEASNLVPNDINETPDVFVRDRVTGTTEMVSVNAEGGQEFDGDGRGCSSGGFPSLSSDGRYVAFQSQCRFVPADTGGILDVYVYDRVTREPAMASVATVGANAGRGGSGDSTGPSISADGRYVAFDSRASNLAPTDTNRECDVFVRDMVMGTTTHVSVSTDGRQANACMSTFPHHSSLSADGRRVVFYGDAGNLVSGDGNNITDVFVHDLDTGTTQRVSVSSSGVPGNGASLYASISPDGRFVAFGSYSGNLVPGDRNGSPDYFLHDLATGQTERASLTSEGSEGVGGGTTEPIIDCCVGDLSVDARVVAFSTSASGLSPLDLNAERDVYARERGPAVGVGGLAATVEDSVVEVSGRAGFAGNALRSASDPVGDASSLGGIGGHLGADLTGASVVHRPEEADMQFRVGVAYPSNGQGRFGVMYTMPFTAGGTRYQVRAVRGSLNALSADSFELFRCAPTCVRIGSLQGSFMTALEEIRVSIPLSTIGATGGTALTDVQASTMFGTQPTGPLTGATLDIVSLDDAAIPSHGVTLGITPPGTPQAPAEIFTPASLVDGRFSGSLDVSSLPAGEYEVWARACWGVTCGVSSVPVHLS